MRFFKLIQRSLGEFSLLCYLSLMVSAAIDRTEKNNITPRCTPERKKPQTTKPRPKMSRAPARAPLWAEGSEQVSGARRGMWGSRTPRTRVGCTPRCRPAQRGGYFLLKGLEKRDLIFNRREVYWPFLTRRLGANRETAAGGAGGPGALIRAVRSRVRCGARCGAACGAWSRRCLFQAGGSAPAERVACH